MKYSRLTLIDNTDVLKKVGREGRNARFSKFLCECGNIVELRFDNVRSGGSKSCGCNHLNEKHKLTGTKIYRIYSNMHSRCFSTTNPRYEDYGGRGITMSEEWRNSFISFYKDRGDCPKGKSLDRIDNNKGYSKENCRWATLKEQANNNRRNILVTYKGQTQTLKEVCDKYSLNYDRVKQRIYAGWDIVSALERKRCGKIKEIVL